MKRSNDDFMAWYDSLSDAQQNAVYEQLCGVADVLGLTVDAPHTEGVDEARQVHCDTVASELLSGVDL